MVETSYNERALQAFLNALTEPALLLDRELTLRAGNLALAERVGLPLTELVGAKQMSFLSPEMAHSRLAHAQRCLDSAQPVVFEDSRAGRHFVNHVMPVLGDQGSVTGVAIVAIDVTRRRRAEQMMRDSESRCQTIISTCVEGVWQIDAESMTSFVNPQMASMLGYSIDEFLGKSMYDFMDDKAREVAEENVRRRQRGISEEHDFRFKHKDDRDVWASLSTNPIHGADGEYIGAVAMVTDITERRVLEQRMLQSQKLESLGVLAGGIAHDFNNLLVGILANVSLAERMVSQQTAALPLLAEVRRAAEAAANLTNELLAYSGKGPFTTEPVDLQAVVAEVSALLTAVISKHARLELNFASNLPAIVADATQVRQVIMNLVTNASDAIGDEPGTIMASTFVAHLDPGRLAGMQLGENLAPGQYVCLEVSDSGEGMDDETVGRIFDPFFTTKFTGRGLGLAAVQGILRGHHAGMEIETELGAGTTLRVFFPSLGEQPPTEEEAEPENLGLPQGSGLALVVDDEPMVLHVAKQVLEMSGFEVETCDRGATAVEIIEARSAEVQFILLDLTMPGMSGAEVFASVRERHPNLPIILMSGYAETAIAELDDSGPRGFVQKPFTVERLLDTVFTVLRSQQ